MGYRNSWADAEAGDEDGEGHSNHDAVDAVPVGVPVDFPDPLLKIQVKPGSKIFIDFLVISKGREY